MELGLDWKWRYITQSNYIEQLELIKQESLPKNPLIINLCDGDEVNGAPGLKFVQEMEQMGMVYTGAGEFFYEITTSKIPMKKLFDLSGIKTPRWEILTGHQDQFQEIFYKLNAPLIIKPAVSGGSMGLGIKNVVYTVEDALKVYESLKNGYKGWKLDIDGFLAEEFIDGREFTTLLTGSAHQPKFLKIYPPVERLFSQNIPATERILSFDRLWETYEEEDELEGGEFLFNYSACESAMIDPLHKLSLDVYHCLKGTGYTRIDIRQKEKTGELYVLEANAQCGLSEDENFTSIGAILRFSGHTFSQMILEIIEDALRRRTQ